MKKTDNKKAILNTWAVISILNISYPGFAGTVQVSGPLSFTSLIHSVFQDRSFTRISYANVKGKKVMYKKSIQ